MSASTGVKALLVAGATEAGGQQSLTLAIIAGAFVVVGAVAGPLATEWFRQRRRPPTDHYAEIATEQAELLNAVIEHYTAELAARDAEIRRLNRKRRDA